MKSLEELMAIKNKMADRVAVRTSSGNTRIVVGMATCGIAAGARPVLNAFVEGISEAGLGDDVIVTQTGCIGICQYEPVVEVFEKDKEKTTYVKMTAEKAKEVIEKHIKGGTPVAEYTIGAAQL
ncbi:MAG: (2Fe-2S) ferredoxin domain-containing protein [Clostridia bacterium]|jgi:Ferredoxin|nr:(2Fe-2S) ferredoxin domain-containing protein [Clostridia bacterium]MBQ3816577.1 (2Fe-2S) ferredoxin domain-containing protein [Clostridia bacterium]MBR4184870.1 (2Fe-2S) ferredoxin domain-containing protein [Clostridia bacterium]MBR4895812.1 (2Fe-2S) ferredoxin domain-containing protein [Clostridia bacterium]